jgi:hypothetical protein
MAHLKGDKKEIIGNLDPQHLVQKSDPLALMRSVPFSLGELKILDTYISRINAADDTRRTVIFTKAEYEELMGLKEANVQTLRKHTKGMLGKVVELQMSNKDYLQFVLFGEAYYHADEYGTPIIELTCTEKAKDLFFCIGKYHYFKYALENIVKLTRKSSYLLYLYIVRNRYRGEWDIDVTDLRDNILDCKNQESYREYKEFKKSVLAPAVKEVNKKTDCHFDYEQIKRGRWVIKIKFIYHSQEQLEGQISIDDLPSVTDHEDYGSEELNDLAAAVNFEFGKEEVEGLIPIMDGLGILPGNRKYYVSEKYAQLRAEEARKQSSDDKPIKHRYKYLISMMDDTKAAKKYQKPLKKKEHIYDGDAIQAELLAQFIDEDVK